MKYGVLTLLLSDFTLALTDKVLVHIAPTTASCAGAEFPEECTDATQVARAINAAFETYGISSLRERVSLVADILFESGNFKYNKNHYPGRPGQGTGMMAMPSFVKPYAHNFRGKPIPPYAILSHRWSAFETLIEDISNGNYREKEEGYWKLRFCAEQAARDGLQYF
ncbi:hypothetical protein KJE20_07054 [Pyrenophora tritici-repentis]|nr:hypothetical protein KJE20_07054 [Pyrenophora tritici-repentis]